MRIFVGFSDMLERYIHMKTSMDGADHTWHLQSGKLLLIHKQLETHGCVLGTVPIDALLLKNHAISIHIAM